MGTASFGLASTGWHVLLARASAWLGRGVRTPVKKALLASAVTKETRGRAFGFERMMDTIGAIVGPTSAFFLLAAFHYHYPTLFALTLIPGVGAAACIAFLVQEKERKKVSHVSFGERLRSMPKPYRKFLVAVGLFGAGDFAHSLLIYLATLKLTPTLGPAKAASIAIALYVVHNILNAASAPIAGWLADRFKKPLVLSAGYALAAVMAVLVIVLPITVWTFALIFALGGIYIALEETLEDSLCAELVEEEHHGMAYGVLATVNGVGDFISSIVVGLLWTEFGTNVAFGYSAVLFILGSLLILRTGTSSAQN